MNKPLRFVTAASLFDGHDVSINIMRRILQSKGAEVIHLGHNRSALEVVDTAICEDAHAIALSSYQGGHMEYFPFVRKLLDERGGKNIRLFGGGGGVITPSEIEKLEKQGVTKIYSPADGVKLGLEGIIDDMLTKANFDTLEKFDFKIKNDLSKIELAKCITALENEKKLDISLPLQKIPVLGITGTGGAGKSSLIDELLIRFRQHFSQHRIALISIDPTRRKTNGALLGDRIRLTLTAFDEIFVRSMATRDSVNELSPAIKSVVNFLKTQNFNLIIIETSGIGQASDEITKIADKSVYVMTPEYGAQTQLEKIEMLDVADFIVVNKYEKAKAEDALRDVRKQYKRNKNLFQAQDDDLPIFGTMASRFNDVGVNSLFFEITKKFGFNQTESLLNLKKERAPIIKGSIIPTERVNYLRLIAETVRNYNQETEKICALVNKVEHYEFMFNETKSKDIQEKYQTLRAQVPDEIWTEIENFSKRKTAYKENNYSYKTKDKEIKATTRYTSLSDTPISIVALPDLNHQDDIVRFVRNQNAPGFFPFAAGIFPFKRKDEEPKRQFAGEGGPKRTNDRFHFLSKDDESKRLSTAFDSVTLYGEDPHTRPDIYGKIGESGVSIATLKDMEELYHGFDLTNPKTSVSMTINGPAPIILAMYFNAAVNQKLKGSDQNDVQKRIDVFQHLRGTVQADILKEDQAQNTCIFSLDFALKMMGDMQEYFCKNKIKNYYSVSISGYHIAEAGANPITQVAFTLANGFTYVEYYLSRGLKIDEFADNLSFFFSNGLDPEYSVIGRVARKIWAIALKYRYGAKEKCQKLKYHIQTSGRSLHAQEIAFNDIRTTLQAYLALSDNCNSLHTNAYDEAITTPTTESVRRAMAIQLIINREFGLNKTDNPMQGSYLLEELSELVEEAVLQEFEKISDRGGVLGAMESMYQRAKIQAESLHYETLKDSGDFPIIGVNTFLSPSEGNKNEEIQLTRASNEEKNQQIERLKKFQNDHQATAQQMLLKLKNKALNNENIFEELLETVRHCSLGQITSVLYEVGGRYRRNV